MSLRIGSTRHTMTLSCTCLSEDFADVLAIVMDVARRPTFPEEELVKRRAEALTAIRQDDDNPAVRAVEKLFEMLYGASHPYGRKAKGTAASLERMDRDALAGFHGRYVRPGALSLAIVGEVDADDALDAASAALDGWRSTDVPLAVVASSAGGLGSACQLDCDAGEGSSRHRVRVHDHQPCGSPLLRVLDDEQHPRAVRPRRPARGQHPRAAGDGVLRVQLLRCDASGPVLCVIRAGVDPNNVERAVAAIDAEVEQLGASGPTETEVAETRQFLVGSIPRMLETNYSIAAFLQTCELFGLGLDYDQRLPSLLQAVTIDEIRAAAADVLRSDRAAVSIAGPEPPIEAQP